jgi:hypothetical protein
MFKGISIISPVVNYHIIVLIYSKWHIPKCFRFLLHAAYWFIQRDLIWFVAFLYYPVFLFFSFAFLIVRIHLCIAFLTRYRFPLQGKMEMSLES